MKYFSHAPENYICPICLAVQGTENDKTMMKQADIIYRDELVMAAINSKFVGNNPGHVIIFPVKHLETLYDLPTKEAHEIIDLSQRVALAMKKIRQCDGIMIRQNNEPASGQHAFHYHMHVFPRFLDDQFVENQKDVRVSRPEERVQFANAFRSYFNSETY